MQRGFSLVELSIVLAIVGLIAGGVVVGQSLLRSSQVRSVLSDYASFSTAEQSFENKYGKIPGDMDTATSYWGKDNTYCSGQSGTANAATGTCNGDNDGTINGTGTPGTTSENFQFWRHMMLGGFITGSYTGIAGPTGSNDHVPGENSPPGRHDGSSWGMRTFNFSGVSDPQYFKLVYVNTLSYGGRGGGLLGAVLTTEEAQTIDTKLDDGMPGSGTAIGFPWSANCTTAADAADLNAATYKLFDTATNKPVSGPRCALYFRRFVGATS